MGNVPSSYFENKREDPFWANDASKSKTDKKSSTSQNLASTKTNFSDAVSKEISETNKEKLSEFALEFARKHEKRREILDQKRKEMEGLRAEVETLKKENEKLRNSRLDPPHKKMQQQNDEIERLRKENEEIDRLRKENQELRSLLSEKSAILEESEKIVANNRELRISIAELHNELQRLNSEVINFEKERDDYKVHVVALKDVISVSKHMLQIRESQLKELKEKVDSIEQNLASREAEILSHDLRIEYDRQIANMRNLRVLYEERHRAEKREKEEIASQLADVKNDVEQEQKKNRELETRISEIELDNSKKYDEIKSLESNLGLAKAENRQYQAELTVINQLFSETLLRYNASQEIDLDKLQKNLEDHHGLLKDIVINEVSSEVSYALPKVLLELINQLHDSEERLIDDDEDGLTEHQLAIEEDQESAGTATRHQMSSAEEIVENLPKVWRVLIELLSHQVVPTNILTDDQSEDDPCYKTVQTPKGPSVVVSVSQTFIRLKDLILEKKSLEKETAHLKHLNCHLENRLQDQEKRLGLVQSELSKTWLVVGKLQKQHQMLHTQEKILRYELAQKRKLLNELKVELEYSRDKWAQAREKNSSTEIQWKQLRTEFANRRNTTTEDVNNSAESGYSDDREGLSDEEPGYETDVSECAQKTGEDTENKDLENEDLSEDIVLPIQNENLERTTENGTSSLEVQVDNQSTNLEENIEDLLVTSVLSTEESSSAPTQAEQNIILDELSCVTIKQDTHDEAEQIKSSESSPRDENDNLERPSSSSSRLQESSSTDKNDNLERPSTSSSRLQDSLTDKNNLERPSTSSTSLQDSRRTLEEMLVKREERLKRLESQAESLVNKTTHTANRSVQICNRLDDLQETYGQSNENNESAENEDNGSERTETVENTTNERIAENSDNERDSTEIGETTINEGNGDTCNLPSTNDGTSSNE